MPRAPTQQGPLFNHRPPGQGRKLDAAVENAIIAKAQAGDLEARNALVEHHLPLIWRFTRKAIGYKDSVDDWIGVGAEAFIKAVRDFDPRMGNRLSTLACRNIVSNVRRERDRTKHLVRVPKNGPNDSPERRRAMEAGRARRAVSIHATPEGERARDIPDPHTSEHHDNTDALRRAMAFLPPHMRHIITRRTSGVTLHGIGADMGVSKERVRQIETEAMERLRAILTRTNPTASRKVAARAGAK